MIARRLVLAAAILLLASPAFSADWRLKPGSVELTSAGPLCFGPDGILFVGDVKSATLYALSTGEEKKEGGEPNVADLGKKLNKLLGEGTKVNDLAVNPATGEVFLSATAGDKPALVRVTSKGDLEKLDLSKVSYSKVTLPDAPEDKVVGEGRRQKNLRLESITDLAYVDSKVIVSGLSQGEAPSTVREIPFPFQEADPGARIEIYHGAHGRVEDYAPVRVFVPFNLDGKPTLLAGFTCTPLVRFPLEGLAPEKKIRGTTVAELGNRNQPLDMISYENEGKPYLLIANSARGVMKVSTENIGREEGITQRISDTAGQEYETIESLKGVVQLDKLSDTQAVVLIESEGGLALKTVALP